MALFVAEVQRTDLSPAGLSRAMLVDHIPQFLDDVLEQLSRLSTVRTSQEAWDKSETARQHGEQRWDLGYDLQTLIREYGVLRHCIIEVAKAEAANISIDEFDTLAKCLSVGVAEAAVEYTKYHDEQLNAQKANLLFLAEAGQVLSSSLDYRWTLTRLTTLLVPRFADWCAVQLERDAVAQMPVAHVEPAKIEAVRELFRLFLSAKDSPYRQAAAIDAGSAQLMPTIAPTLLESVAQGAEHLALLQEVAAHSWMLVPLRVQQQTFGTLVLAYSDSRRTYSEQDLVLATELANRAATSIDNARLYELSQRERSLVEAAGRAKDAFVAMVSHELRTPLHAILGWVNLLRSGRLGDAQKAHALEVLDRNAQAQQRLISDLLDISGAIAGTFRINPSQVNLSDLLDMAVEGVRPAADAKRIHIQLAVDRQNAILRGDPDRLQQVLWNLLINAVKFTPKDGAISIQLRRVASEIELTVQDNGIGIDAEFVPHIFESFRQAETGRSRRHGGLGLGLSIAKHIIDLHGGSIEAQSQGAGMGATFTVRFPVSSLISTPPGRDPHAPATKPPLAGSTLPDTVGVRVLVVDDDPDARELLAYVLQSRGIEVRVADSAAQALTALEQFTPNVLVSDIGMPDEDGFSLIRKIRTLPNAEKRDIPAIALTAFAGSEDRTRALVAGFNHYMAKPAEPAALVNAVLELAGVSPPTKQVPQR